MNRLKLLATATLMALTLTACDEGTPPPVEPPPPPTPVGTISGTVTIEGTAASGVTATLSSGATTTTGSGGSFAFSGVEAGTYTVTISGFPEDATFAQVTQSATIATDGQNVQLNFAGEYIRSSAVVGAVVAADAAMSGGDGQPETLGGVTVTLEGEHAAGETMETDANGGFAFTGLRAGTYTVTISDYPEDVSFETVSVEVEVEVGEVGNADFTGHFIRTSAVEGQVIIEGEGLAGVTVTLAGGPADESYTAMTDADGMYRFEDLRPGDYTVSISDFDMRDYEFASTSQDVSVDLDETGTVSFTGVLLRTSGISGRVSVEGMGLGGVEVTLSGGEESRSATTDDGGQYSFAGLAAGDYTVSIAVESAAYVFESMSSDVTLGDDESAIVNFDGAHARTASVSGMAYLDEASKNDMYDEGEHPLAAAGIPVALVGPGVNEQRLGATDAQGMFSFTGLRAASYQLVVLIDATVAGQLAAADVAYGGAASGYALDVGVGEAATQNVPFDITHTTVNVAVTLKGGDHRGQPVPGAAVTLYSDAAGETKVGGGETMASEAGVFTSIKVARAGTTDNTVYMGVAADGYFVDPTAEMQAVTWDPQSFTHPPMGAEVPAVLNDADIVNLGVDVSVGGATVTRGDMGGAALANWAIGVMSGADAENLTAVEGAPAMLDGDGMASLKTTVTPDALPVTYHFAVAPDQADSLDGGENFEGSTVSHTHTGLMLAGTQDAGTIEVAYTTQKLMVYVHHEKDQVFGYTGNILGGDERDDGKVSVAIRYIDGSGRSRSFAAADSVGSKAKDGVHTFSNVPAGSNVIVQASDGQEDKTAEGYMAIKVLDSDGHSDELAAYTAPETNGITGGMFGDMGGSSHTVTLCPLQKVDPTKQDHGDCASFAYVSTHTVSGQLWKMGVERSGDDFKEEAEVFVKDMTVSLTPVDGKNLAGKKESFTTAEKDTRKDKTKGLDATHEFSFDGVAAGVYTLGVPAGWRAMLGEAGSDVKVGNTFNPLGGNAHLDVTPATATVYGSVIGSDKFPLDSVTVTIDGQTDTTDGSGRYIVEGVTADKKFVIMASRGGQVAFKSDSVTFAANTVTKHSIDMKGVQARATISGTVRASGTNEPVAGVEIKVDDKAPENAATKGANKGKYVTLADGTYSVEVAATDAGGTVAVSASKKGMTFVPASISVPAHAGSSVAGIDFTGFVNATISGRVVAPGGGPQSGVVVKATSVPDSAVVVVDTTGVTGAFSLNVPFGVYTMDATLKNHIFDWPATGQVVNVAPGQQRSFGDIKSKTAGARDIKAARQRVLDNPNTDDTDEGDPTSWGPSILVTYKATAGDVATGYSDATYTVQTNTGSNGAWADQGTTPVNDADNNPIPGQFTITNPSDAEFKLRVIASVANDDQTEPTQTPYADTAEAAAPVAAVDPTASNITAVRDTANAAETDSIVVTWDAVTNDNSAFRIVAEISPNTSQPESRVWVSLSGNNDNLLEDNIREWQLKVGDDFNLSVNLITESGTGSNITIGADQLRAAFTIGVESVQGTPSSTNKFKRGGTASVDESTYVDDDS